MAGVLRAGLTGLVAAAGLTACSLLAPPDEDPSPEQSTDGSANPSDTQAPTGPAELTDPIELAIVEEADQAPCSGDYLPGPEQQECLLLGDGMTITEVEELAMATPTTGTTTGADEDVLQLTMTSQDGADFYELTSRAAELPEPRIAMVVDGEVVSAPTLDQPIPGGAIEIAGWDGAEEFVAQATTG